VKKWIGLWLVLVFTMLPGWVMADPVDKLERVNSLIATRIADVLDLEPHKADRLRFVLKKYQLRKLELRRQTADLTRQLQVATKAGNKPETERILNAIRQSRSELKGIDDAQMQELGQFLTPTQQAKYLLVVDDIRKEIQSLRRGGFENEPGGNRKNMPPPNPGAYQEPGQDTIHLGNPWGY